jgi:hypothetical protein
MICLKALNGFNQHYVLPEVVAHSVILLVLLKLMVSIATEMN